MKTKTGLRIFFLMAVSIAVVFSADPALAGKHGGMMDSGSGSGSGDAPPPNPGGEALYLDKCQMCHGVNANDGFAKLRSKMAGVETIKQKIATRPEMNFLSYLTDGEISAIAGFLSTVPHGWNMVYGGDPSAGEASFRSSCTGCHTFGNGVHIGPDLIEVSWTMAKPWLAAWAAFPKEMVAAGAYTDAEMSHWPYQMPDLGHTNVEAMNIASFLARQGQVGPLEPTEPVQLTDVEYEETKNLFFNRCAGCHGLYRLGATGPNIDEFKSQTIGTDGLGALLRHGTPGGMPNFGTSGILTEQEITNLAAYLQMPPPDPPPLEMPEIINSWELLVPVVDRPTAPEHLRNWENFIGVILRDAGQVAIFDGDTHEEVVRVNTGFAVHILRSSSSGRYFYSIGRDGLVTMIDLWATVPNVVARVKGCHDARSVDGSKFSGYEDRYLIEGCYWPPQYIVFDGLTLEPLTKVDLPMTNIYGDVLPEVRVAAIVASHYAPVWAISLKESGYVGIVDYSLPDFPLVSTIATELFLHDGGFDHTGRYFMVAANASNKMVVVDLEQQSFVTSITTGIKPHPGRGANWVDPVYGWVNATPHIGEAKVTVYGADPVENPDVAWRVVREIAMPTAGSLFIKTHPNSPWVLVDMPLSPSLNYSQQVCAISKATGAIDRCFTAAANGKATHMEFNMDGSEVWVSDWAPDGGLVILDGVTLQEVARITGLPTPTGKFNVYNTAHDIY